MKFFETTKLLEKMHLSTFKKITLPASTWSFESYPCSIHFWVATPEVKTRNATARAQEKKVSGPGNRIGWPYEAAAWIQRNGATSIALDFVIIWWLLIATYLSLSGQILWAQVLSPNWTQNKIFPNSNQIHIFLQRIHQSCAHLSYVCHGSSFWKSSCACVMILRASIASMVRLIWAMSSACKVQWIQN